jgi:predicted deacylase
MIMGPQVARTTMELAGTDVPVVEVTGSGDGPQLTVISGVHGCEYASIAGVRRWLQTLETRELRGRVRAVPVLNITGFRARAPFIVPEDGKNLNRCWPGDPAGTLADRLAHAAFTEFIEGADAVVDAHCGDMVEALEPFALFEAGPAEDRARALAEAYGLGYVLRQEAGPEAPVSGTTSGAAAAIGVPAITAEAGGCGLVEQAAVDLHVRGLNGVLAQLGMADAPAGEATAAAPEYLGRFLWPHCTDAGWWAPAVRAGERVSEGQLLGQVESVDGGQVQEEIRSPADGVLIFVTSSPAVAADGLLLGLGAR